MEYKPEIAKVYSEFFPQDTMIVGDAHQYLLDHYSEFDFIWSSPPCPSHSRARFWGSFGENRTKIYPDMRLYQEILFLQHYFKGKWVVENVKPYYKVLMEAQHCGRHLFWANFLIPKVEASTMFFPKDSLPKLQEIYGIDLSKVKTDIDKRVILRNCVEPKLGQFILDLALNPIKLQREMIF